MLEQELKELILKELKIEDVSVDELTDETPLFNEGIGLDSLDAVELVILLKKHYKIDIAEVEVAQKVFANIGTLANYIREHGETMSDD